MTVSPKARSYVQARLMHDLNLVPALAKAWLVCAAATYVTTTRYSGTAPAPGPGAAVTQPGAGNNDAGSSVGRGSTSSG